MFAQVCMLIHNFLFKSILQLTTFVLINSTYYSIKIVNIFKWVQSIIILPYSNKNIDITIITIYFLNTKLLCLKFCVQ